MTDDDCENAGECCVKYHVGYCGVPSDCNEYLQCRGAGNGTAFSASAMSDTPATNEEFQALLARADGGGAYYDGCPPTSETFQGYMVSSCLSFVSSLEEGIDCALRLTRIRVLQACICSSIEFSLRAVPHLIRLHRRKGGRVPRTLDVLPTTRAHAAFGIHSLIVEFLLIAILSSSACHPVRRRLQPVLRLNKVPRQSTRVRPSLLPLKSFI